MVGVCPATLQGITSLSQHAADGGEAAECECFLVQVRPILGQPSAAIEPTDGAFDDPALWQQFEAIGMIGSVSV